MTAAGGRSTAEHAPPSRRRSVEFSASRMLLRRLVEVVAEPVDAAAAARPHRRADRRRPRGRGLLGLRHARRRDARAVRDRGPRRRGGAPDAAAGRRGPGRHDRGAGHGRSTPPTPRPTPTSATSRRPARRSTTRSWACRSCAAAGRRRAGGAEPGPARLRRGRDRGAADHRLGPGRDVRLRRADRPEQVRRSVRRCLP